MSIGDQDPEIQQTFLEEAQQILEDTEGAFIALDAGDRSDELVQKIFRLAHNFKGSAKIVGFDELSTFAHKLEDVLTRIKNHVLEPDKAVCSVLLEALDGLKVYISGLSMDLRFRYDYSPIAKRLEELLQPKAQIKAQPKAQTKPQTKGQSKTQTKASPHPTAPAPKAAAASAPQAPAARSEDEFLRVSVKKLDALMDLAGEILLYQSMVSNYRQSGKLGSPESASLTAQMDKLVNEMQDSAMSLRMVPIQPLLQKMRRAVRDLGEAQSKTIDFVAAGEEIELDRTVLSRITDPLTHLIRNAVDHGVEGPEDRKQQGKPATARVSVDVIQKDNTVEIRVCDDGRGLDADALVRKAIEKGLLAPGTVLSPEEAYDLIFLPGFSTKEAVTDISGRGVGMDVVKTAVNELRGAIRIETRLKAGTSFIIELPLSVSVLTGLVVKVDLQSYVVPLAQLLETIEFGKLKIESSTGDGRVTNLRGEVLPVLSLSSILRTSQHSADRRKRKGDRSPGLIARVSGHKVSFEVDEILGQQRIVVKPLGKEMQGIPGIVAGAVLSDGEPGLVLSLEDILQERRSHAA